MVGGIGSVTVCLTVNHQPRGLGGESPAAMLASSSLTPMEKVIRSHVVLRRVGRADFVDQNERLFAVIGEADVNAADTEIGPNKTCSSTENNCRQQRKKSERKTCRPPKSRIKFYKMLMEKPTMKGQKLKCRAEGRVSVALPCCRTTGTTAAE